MLRITHAIALVFRKKEPLFSKDFWKGFGLALLLHLLLLFTFRIISLPNLDHLHPLTPISVETDLTNGHSTVLTPIQVAYSPLQTPPPAQPIENLNHPSVQLNSSLFALEKIPLEDPSFSEIETIEYQLYFLEGTDD